MILFSHCTVTVSLRVECYNIQKAASKKIGSYTGSVAADWALRCQAAVREPVYTGGKIIGIAERTKIKTVHR